MFSLICTWTNGWVNNCEAGDLRRRRAHYDVTVMRFHRPPLVLQQATVFHHVFRYYSLWFSNIKFNFFLHPSVSFSFFFLFMTILGTKYKQNWQVQNHKHIKQTTVRLNRLFGAGAKDCGQFPHHNFKYLSYIVWNRFHISPAQSKLDWPLFIDNSII